MILISQWYTPKDRDRLNELLYVRERNESSGVFDAVVYLDGDSRRLSFRDLFSEASSKFAGQICVVANTDIVFDETMKLLPSVTRKNRIVALTRWESPLSPRMIGHYTREMFFSGSQDSWAFEAGSIASLELDIPTGEQGCEQALLGWAVSAGIEIVSPSIDIKTWHVHEDKNVYGNMSVAGMYAYPRMTTCEVGGGVVCVHNFPCEMNSRGAIDAAIISTCP